LDKKIFNRYNFPKSLQGGNSGRSLSSNANIHFGKKNVAHFDIKSFFPSISPKRVYETFINLGSSPDVARLLTRLVTAQGHLPQGFITSPKMSALVLLSLDKRLVKLFKKFGLKHSFWIDDLCISGSFPIDKLYKIIERIFKQEGFTINPLKIDYKYSNKRQVVTGVIVNKKPDLAREKRKYLEKILYICKKYGLDNFLNKSGHDQSFIKSFTGELSYAVSINPIKYRPLLEEWKSICNSS